MESLHWNVSTGIVKPNTNHGPKHWLETLPKTTPTACWMKYDIANSKTWPSGIRSAAYSQCPPVCESARASAFQRAVERLQGPNGLPKGSAKILHRTGPRFRTVQYLYAVGSPASIGMGRLRYGQSNLPQCGPCALDSCELRSPTG